MAVDKSGERVQQMFGEIAPRYDFLNHFLSLGIDRYWRWQTVRKVPPTSSDPILDLCTGTGDLALAYARASQGNVVGSDFCHPMLTRAVDKGNRSPVAARLSWMEADAQALPLADDQFQIVSVAFGLRNVNDTLQGLREMVRVCRPGGRVVVLEFSQPRWRPWRAVYQWYFQRVLPRIGQALARNRESAYNYLPQSVGEFPSGQALATLMEQAGLHSVRFWPFTLGVATLYVGDK